MNSRSVNINKLALQTMALSLTLLFAFPTALIAAAADKDKSGRTLTKVDQAKVEMQSYSAVSDNQNGALLEWQSLSEKDNVGYNVYRTANGETVKLNETVIAGVYLLNNPKAPAPLTTGKEYSFFDEKGTTDAQYVIEAVLLTGTWQKFTVQTEFNAETLNLAGRPAQVQKDATAGSQLSGQLEMPAEMSATSQSFADANRQRWVAAQPGLKFSVKTNGLYRVTRQQLSDNGFDVTVPTANWQLYADGVEQNLLVNDAPNGGVMGANGYVEFYGAGINTRYSDTKVYFLVVGTSAGKRIVPTRGRGTTVKAPAPSFASVVQCRSESLTQCNTPSQYAYSAANGDDENFFGTTIFNLNGGVTSSNFTFNTPSVDTQALQASIEVSILGFSTAPPERQILVFLNDTQIGTMSSDSDGLLVRRFDVPASMLLTGGVNKVRLTPNIAGEIDYTNYARIYYSRRYVAANNQLLFTSGYSRGVRVDGFADNTLRVFDVTDPNNVTIFNYRSSQDANSLYSATISTPRPRTMYALTNAAIATPLISRNTASNLNTSALNRDLVIITYKDWRSAADNLATYRRGQGLTVTVADIEDVFDEFSFGSSSASAIQEMLRLTTPRYTLLMGDASADGRNYLGRGSFNFIPTILLQSAFGEISSDEALGDYRGVNNAVPDFVSEMPIGRLSVRDNATAQMLVNKITAFEASVAAGNTFNRGAYFIADYPRGYDFAGTNRELATHLPAGTPVQFTDVTAEMSNDPAVPGFRNEIVSRVNQGPFIVGYAGHGAITFLGDAQFLRRQEAALFTNNNDKLSIYLMLTCLIGSYADPTTVVSGSNPQGDSLSELLTKAQNRGAIAVWSSSGLTIADGQDVMARHFYDLHRDAAVGARIGDLVKESKLETFDTDVRASWIFFGDPTLKIK